MINGNHCWNQEMINDLTIRTFNNREYSSFDHLKRSMYQTIKENAEQMPDKIGIVDSNEKPYTYKDLLELTDRMSAYLVKHYQVQKGTHIGLLLFNSIEFIVSFLSAQKLGAVIVPFPTKYKEPAIDSLIEKSDCDILIADEKYKAWMEKHEIQGKPVLIFGDRTIKDLPAYDIDTVDSGTLEDHAVIMFTSGTTSFSKGVVIKNFNLQHAVTAYQKLLRLDETDSTVLSIPIYNITGLAATLCLFLQCKGTIYLHKFFDADRLLTNIEQYQVTFYHASPTIFALLLEKQKQYPELPSLQMLGCGSGNMPGEMIAELKNWMPNMSFRTIYGLSETTSPATIFPSDASQSKYVGSSGLPIPGLCIKVVDEDGQEVKQGTIGEICLKGTNVIEEYYKLDTGLITDDKWLLTGDLGYVNEDGYLYIVDRKKDMINRGGEKVFSYDIENEIRKIEGVHEVAVVGKKDSKYGEVPIAVLSVKEGSHVDEPFIRFFLKDRLAKYEIPAKFYFVEEVDKTENGKIDKKAIRERFGRN
ncbi:class I adenylate-forming enzyme family protein [Siminovitchia sediminis]|uniref:Class I adenylate-forming enzyme family protein n=1 Tax=Siminovitchia sediminis TaxID=1274353 RepID=A0ABW4KM55_9BACI